ncbi:HbrB-domain-containing protein [Ramaria rubella]|nr:HbrB-domain-containing protein [Ramaria rubella]
MRRPISPSPRRSQDTRPNTPPPVAQLRRSSSDVSYRPNRLLAKLKNASSSSSSNASAGVPKLQVPSHTRTSSIPNSALTPPASSPTSPPASSKVSTSPKSARDMHRLGAIPAQVATLAPPMANPASASSLSLASTLTNNTASPTPSTTDPWHMLHVHVLPLFNGEPLRMPIEELNQLVKKHISTVVSRSLSRAITSLEQDITALLARGMITLNVKLSELDDEKLLPRLGEVWEFFWHGILPYVEGVFHPLQTDKLVQSLSRTPKSNRPSSPTLQEDAPSAASQSIDVRLLALRQFRDSILLPISTRLHTLLSTSQKDSIPEGSRSQYPKLQQMLLVLVATSHPSHAVTSPPPSPTQGENAVTHLLRAIRNPRVVAPPRPFSVARLPSFFSASAPRDRRGRIARKSVHHTTLNLKGVALREQSPDGWDDETPRNAGFGDDRDREKEFLESLRSPGLAAEEEGRVEGPTGGWGLGRGQEQQGEEDDDDDEPLDWDQAQGVVERMVGLRG